MLEKENGAVEIVEKTDPFGTPKLNEDGTQPEPVEATEKKPEEKDGKAVEKKGEDKDSVIAGLQAEIAKLQGMSGNLSAQRAIIDRLEKEITTLKGAKDSAGGEKGEEKKEEDVLFSDIKYSKDLTQQQRDDMTEAEIAQMDEIARLKEAQNKMYKTMLENNKKGETKAVEDMNTTARTGALALATEAIKTQPGLGKDAEELANKILVEFGLFNNAGISEKEVEVRLQKALRNVPSYTPPKEQPTRDAGGKPAGGGGGGSDQFGTDAIIKQAQGNTGGGYSL